MAKAKTPKRKTAKPASKGFTAEERAAMRERARELKSKGDGETDVLAKIAEMPPKDRAMAKKLHGIVTKSAPSLTPRTWYGMPAYSNQDGKVVCFFRNAGKFKDRYGTFGFNDAAKLDDGEMWPTSFALTKLTPAGERKIARLVRKAAR